MATASGAATRRASARAHPRSTPARPALRVVDRSPRQRLLRPVRRPALWLSGLLVVGSLVAVVAGDDLVTQGQIRLATTEAQVAAAQVTQKADQVAVAQLAAPTRVVAVAKAQLGMVAPGQVIDLPEVPLSVPLPVPQTAATGPRSAPPKR